MLVCHVLWPQFVPSTWVKQIPSSLRNVITVYVLEIPYKKTHQRNHKWIFFFSVCQSFPCFCKKLFPIKFEKYPAFYSFIVDVNSITIRWNIPMAVIPVFKSFPRTSFFSPYMGFCKKLKAQMFPKSYFSVFSLLYSAWDLCLSFLLLKFSYVTWVECFFFAREILFCLPCTLQYL